MAKKNAFYAQSGGVTAVINASACGVIEACREHRDKIGTLYAGQNGIIGALQENLIDTSKETVHFSQGPQTYPGRCLWLLPLQDERSQREHGGVRAPY